MSKKIGEIWWMLLTKKYVILGSEPTFDRWCGSALSDGLASNYPRLLLPCFGNNEVCYVKNSCSIETSYIFLTYHIFNPNLGSLAGLEIL